MLAGRVGEAGCAIAYVNQVGGQDELVFDGASLVVGRRRHPAGRRGPVRPSCSWSISSCRTAHVGPPTGPAPGRPAPGRASGWSTSRPPVGASPPACRPPVPDPLGPDAEVYEALVLGTRDYLAKNGFTDAVIGLSGGIDSSLVATVAVDAIGPEQVHALSMPSRYSSDGSRTDAERLAERLGHRPAGGAHRGGPRRPDGPPRAGARRAAAGPGRREPPVADARGAADGGLQRPGVDRAHDRQQERDGHRLLDPLRRLGRRVRRDQGRAQDPGLRAVPVPQRTGPAAGAPPPIPDAVLDKPPSAELRPDQRDDQSLPPYELLDPVLDAYVEQDRTARRAGGRRLRPRGGGAGGAPGRRGRVQATSDAPGVRITTKAFGKDRRMPITNHYRPQTTATRRRPGRGSVAEAAEPGATAGAAPPGAGPGGRRLPLDRAPAVRADRGLGGRRPLAEVQVHLDEVSRQHAWHAELWAERLPVLDGVDPGRSPDPRPGGRAPPLRPGRRGHRLARGVPGGHPRAAAPTTGQRGLGVVQRLAGLYRVVLPRLLVTYGRPPGPGRCRWPDGPVIRALRLVRRDELEAWQAGERVLEELLARPTTPPWPPPCNSGSSRSWWPATSGPGSCPGRRSSAR